MLSACSSASTAGQAQGQVRISSERNDEHSSVP